MALGCGNSICKSPEIKKEKAHGGQMELSVTREHEYGRMIREVRLEKKTEGLDGHYKLIPQL